MAVTTVKQQNNTLGMLGTLASLGGMATGQPWLSALGTGMRGMNAMMNGDSSMETGEKTDEALSKVLDKLKNIWKNPADDNIAKTEQQNAQKKAQDILGTDTELSKKWGNNGGNWAFAENWGQPNASRWVWYDHDPNGTWNGAPRRWDWGW